MKKQWMSKLEELEAKSKTLNADELFDLWIIENYPQGNLQYHHYWEIMQHVPQEFKEICLDRFLKEMRNLQNGDGR